MGSSSERIDWEEGRDEEEDDRPDADELEDEGGNPGFLKHGDREVKV